MVYCVVLREIPTHGLGASPTMEMPPELLPVGSPCTFTPGVHRPVPPAHPGDTALVMCSWGKAYHEPRGVQQIQCSAVLQPPPCVPASSRHSPLFAACSSAFPDPQPLLPSPSSPGWIVLQASFLWLPCPLHPLKKRMQLCKSKAGTKQKRTVLCYFLFWPF